MKHAKITVLVLGCCLCLFGCANRRVTVGAEQTGEFQVQGINRHNASVPANWTPLWERLASDGLDDPRVAVNLARLGDSFTQDPMGRKVKELYTNAFIPRTPSTSTPDTSPNDTPIPRPWYRGFVTEANAKTCLSFIQANSRSFLDVQQRYGVPPSVISALLYVETKHGGYLGEQEALLTLASMASSTSTDQIPDWLEQLPGVEERLDWVEGKMRERSEWAYKELKPLLAYCLDNGLDPVSMPCSIYGAIGLCQFMPSNIATYAADGDYDGVIDLFNPADAVASAANYLQRHGWKPGLSIEEQIKVLRKYNNSSTYANTILALAYKTSQLSEYADLGDGVAGFGPHSVTAGGN